MACLNDFDSLRNAIKNSRKSSIVALHKFIYEGDGDRGNRQRLRTFTGFPFDERDEQYNLKCSYIKENLSSIDLTSICILLGLNPNEKDVSRHIFRNLCAGRLCQDVTKDDDDADNDSDDDENAENTVIPHESEDERGINDDDNSVKSVIDDNDDSSIKTNDYGHRDKRAKETTAENRPRFMLNFRDIEDSIRPFDGSNSVPVEVWVQEFEETAAMLDWDALQMLIFAKKSLKGLAKLFVSGEKGLTTWVKLKDALFKEFKLKVNSRQVHKTLTARTMKNDETVLEYLYKMKEIAASGNVVDRDLIQYVIDGIRDVNINK